jgi:hypothetical protein
MKNPHSVYFINDFIAVKEHELFKLLDKYFKYGIDFDYIARINECVIQLSQEIDEDPEIIKLLKLYNFVKEK